MRNEPEVEAIRKAIDKTGRAIALSLSPGATDLKGAAHVERNANMWRISDDFWDTWKALNEQFARLQKWSEAAPPGPGHWPDADMLPLGTLDQGKRQTRFTPDEQVTMLTLWSIARPPAADPRSADLAKLDEATLALVTNDEVIAVDQASAHGRQLFNHDGLVAWLAEAPDGGRYLALFNTNTAPVGDNIRVASALPISAKLADLGHHRSSHGTRFVEETGPGRRGRGRWRLRPARQLAWRRPLPSHAGKMNAGFPVVGSRARQGRF